MAKPYSYDSACLDLARHFGVTDDDAAAEDLAQTIQDAVEAWFVGRNEDGSHLTPGGEGG